MNLWLVALLGTAFTATLVWAQGLESTDRYGTSFVKYAQVDRTDGTYRRMLTTPDVLDAAQSGQPLPDGTRILMETYYRPGELSTVFHEQKVDGRWEYGSFDGQGDVRLDTRPQASCLSCHSRAAETDFTFTKPALDAALDMGEITLSCDRSGRRPCTLSTYRVSVAD
ncbi:cytochrome P460 family protein [Cognatiyoonia sp. IB215446]|uniref:cytochrome P460 family protein n=1 Tax=Cognatiyoonia sp. IB215446 TaxID=3097355 RepID=UPI002A17541B|nr:cytochrome P460 family protein [Cognatiyoonia sp. IB215446]MDX8350454.1 cytochrome P460 family protein [Cognatiyoonia sp. IB215446]